MATPRMVSKRDVKGGQLAAAGGGLRQGLGEQQGNADHIHTQAQAQTQGCRPRLLPLPPALVVGTLLWDKEGQGSGD